VGPKNHVLDGGRNPPWEEAILRGKGASHYKILGHFAVICAKTAEPIEMLFWGCGLGWVVGIVLDGGPAVLRDIAMATNFVMQFAITGFVGYNFRCMIASDTLVDSRGGFSGSSYPMKTWPILRFLETLPWQPFFGFLYMGARWRHLANTTEPSMCGGYSALCQITLTILVFMLSLFSYCSLY